MIFDLLANGELLFAIVPGLILFLYGIEHFSIEIQRICKRSAGNVSMEDMCF